MTLQLAWAVQEELENLLDDSGHLRTLAFLYASKGRNSKALAIWKLLARNYSSGLWKDPKATVHNNLDSSTNIISCQRSAALEASKLLEESSDQELVLQHLRWVCTLSLSKNKYFCDFFYNIYDGLTSNCIFFCRLQMKIRNLL